MIHNKFRYLLTLVALFAISTGAWADETPLVTIESKNYTSFTSGSMTFDDKVTVTFSSAVANYGDSWGWNHVNGTTLTVTPVEGITITRVKFTCEEGSAFDETAPFEAVLGDGDPWNNTIMLVNGNSCGEYGVNKIEVYGTAGPEVTWNATTKQATFTMPGSDVVLTPVYAPTAAWAEVETVKQLPAAAEGVIAGTTAPLIIEGTVANAGTTENPQGLVMYYAAKGTADAAPTAPTLESQWSADVPTAEAYINDEDGATVYVWYYIAGANTPDGEDPTADNTFNDSEICAKPLKVTLLSNKFDLALKAANANTIEAGKATVTVGGTAATVTDGKLQGVKMGSEVKMTAKQGYKFRKVEATKGISTLKSVKIGNYTVYYAEGETWYQAFRRDENNNCGLETSVGRVFTYNDKSLRDSDGDVYADAVINPSKGYYIAD